MVNQLEERINARGLSTFLTTIGAVLTCSLLIWIASNQVEIVTSQAVLQRDVQAQTRAFNEYNKLDRLGDLEVRDFISKIWPRLRNNSQNIAILKKHMEDICVCEVELKRPEKF